MARARQQLLQANDGHGAARLANDLGVIYYRLGLQDEARRVFEEALPFLVEPGDKLEQAKTLGNLAQIQNKSGNIKSAETNYGRAAQLFHESGERGLEYDTWRAVSHMRLMHGRWLEALAAYDLALAAKGSSGLRRFFFRIPLKLLGVRG
jgi:tetratricopeptide (TPR) repeat protein